MTKAAPRMRNGPDGKETGTDNAPCAEREQAFPDSGVVHFPFLSAEMNGA